MTTTWLDMPSDASIHLTTLGDLTVRASSPSGERSLSKGKPAALLAYLACAPARRASRERLATLLWADGTSESARQNLRQTLWYLKRRLGDVLDANDDAVAIAAAVTCDREAFVLAAEAGAHGEALALYTGPFIAEFAAPGADEFEEWCSLERRRLAGVFAACADLEARTHLAQGRFADAVHVAQRARNELPLEQSSWRLLLEALIAARDTVGLTAELARVETLLDRDDVDPEPATKAVMTAAKRLLRGDGSAPEQQHARDETTLVPDLVGREAEFRFLIDAWDRTSRGRGESILITGAAGLGKSRLITDFRARLVAGRARTVLVRAHQGNRAIHGALAASIAEALVDVPGALGVPPSSADVLVALSPKLSETFSGATTDTAEGDNAVRRRAIALGDLILATSEERPLALLVDDLHWADTESLRILAGARARADGQRALFVFTSRVAHDATAAIGQLQQLDLRPLDLAGVADFVGRLGRLPSESWPATFLPALLAATHGIPFELIESLQRLIQVGALRLSDGAWSAPEPMQLAQEVAMGSAIERRIAALTADERVALIRLAMLGRPIPLTDPATSALHALDGSPQTLGFTRHTDDTIAFTHDEIAEAVLESTSVDERREAHRWVAESLRTSTVVDDRVLAVWHADRAGAVELVREMVVREVSARRTRGDSRPALEMIDEVFGDVLTEPMRRELAGALPRPLRRPRSTLQVAAAAALIAVAAIGGVWSARPLASEADSAIHLYYGIAEHPDSLLRVSIDREKFIRPAINVVSAERLPEDGTLTLNALVPDPRTDGWIADGFNATNGNDEVFLVGRNGIIEQPVLSAFDDGGSTPSPDGRYLAFSTARYDTITDHMHLAILDRETGAIRQLTHGTDVEMGAIWSPDGSRLAFHRIFYREERDAAACVISFDGTDERCDIVPANELSRALGWTSDGRLVVQHNEGRSITAIDVDLGHVSSVATNASSLLMSVLGTVAYCHCVNERTGERELMIFDLDRPGDPYTVHIPRGMTLTSLRLVETARDGRVPWLERVEFVPIPSAVPLDGTHRLRVVGYGPWGSRLRPRALSYRSADTSIATVDTTGLVRPRRLGRTMVYVIAGGWRTDSVLVTVGSAVSSLVVQEDWTADWLGRWRPFGDPRPRIATIGGEQVFVPNGDGSYASGAYTVGGWSARDGIAVEARVRLPILFPQWQTLGFTINSEPSTDWLSRWDHVTGAPSTRSFRAACIVGFPFGEGGTARRGFVLSSPNGEQREIPVDSTFYSGRPTLVRLQLFPDGRCGVAIDGVARGIIESPAPDEAPMRVWIHGHSVGSALTVGALSIWTGLRTDIRWE